jgi:hypothetical protein
LVARDRGHWQPGPGGGSSHGEAADSESLLHRQVGADLDLSTGRPSLSLSLVVVLVSGRVLS